MGGTRSRRASNLAVVLMGVQRVTMWVSATGSTGGTRGGWGKEATVLTRVQRLRGQRKRQGRGQIGVQIEADPKSGMLHWQGSYPIGRCRGRRLRCTICGRCGREVVTAGLPFVDVWMAAVAVRKCSTARRRTICSLFSYYKYVVGILEAIERTGVVPNPVGEKASGRKSHPLWLTILLHEAGLVLDHLLVVPQVSTDFINDGTHRPSLHLAQDSDQQRTDTLAIQAVDIDWQLARV